jgi:sigma-54 dependent transcriptional regulator, acetoin dehydrogenase operon transcriptional activator AcoR
MTLDNGNLIVNKDSEEFSFKNFFENGTEGFFRSTPNGRFLTVNPSLADMLGYTSADELVGDFQDLRSQLYVIPEDRDRFLDNLEKYGKSGMEIQFKCRDGSVKWISLRARKVPVNGFGSYYIEGLIIDITSRKNIELALRESEDKFRRTFDQAPIGAAIVDLDLKFVRVNRVLCDISGYSEDELLNKKTVDLVHPDDRALAIGYIDRLLSGELDYYENDRRFVHKNGNIIWVTISMRLLRDEFGRPNSFLPMYLDITSRKNALDALEAAQNRYHAIVEDQIEQVCRHKVDGRHTFANDAYAKFFQQDKNELIGSVFQPEIPEEDKTMVENFMNGLTPQKPVTYMEHRVALPSGHIRWLRRSVRAFFDAEGKPTEYQVVARDVTERVVAEQEIRRISNEKEQYRLNLEAVFSSIPDAVLTLDPDMNVIHINRALSGFCCISDNLVPGKSLMGVAGSCDRSCFGILFKALMKKEPVIEYRLECLVSKPRKVFVVNSSLLRDHERRFKGTVLLIRDITRLANLENQVSSPSGYKNIIGKSSVMQEVYRVMDLLADVETTLLVTGESGTGKELIAEALHYGGSRANGPLIKVNCAALAENLLESELFGHVRGAFTGAVQDKIGRFEAAEGGTLFLDEVGDIPLSTQLKLLRVLERKEYERVGDSKTMKADVRVITATNVDLQKKIRQGLFREDVYYRLKVMTIQLPPLRDRSEDIPVLCQHFVNLLNFEYEKNISRVSDEVMRIFMGYQWPGNIREMRHTLEHAFILCPAGEIRTEHLPRDFNRFQGAPAPNDLRYRTKVDRESIIEAINSAGGNKAKAARQLGIDRRTLYRNLEKR